MLANYMKTWINEAAIEALVTETKIHKKMDWISEETLMAIRMKIAYNIWLSSKTARGLENYHTAKRQAKRIVRKSQKENWEKIC